MRASGVSAVRSVVGSPLSTTPTSTDWPPEAAASVAEGTQSIWEAERTLAGTTSRPPMLGVRMHATPPRSAKPAPCTSMGVPPTTGPAEGVTAETETAALSKYESCAATCDESHCPFSEMRSWTAEVSY
jgi:hypothetical protein